MAVKLLIRKRGTFHDLIVINHDEDMDVKYTLSGKDLYNMPEEKVIKILKNISGVLKEEVGQINEMAEEDFAE